MIYASTGQAECKALAVLLSTDSGIFEYNGGVMQVAWVSQLARYFVSEVLRRFLTVNELVAVRDSLFYGEFVQAGLQSNL